jgi:diaminopimelate decarboxylase
MTQPEGIQVTDTTTAIRTAGPTEPSDHAAADALRRHCHGLPPLDARLESWQVALLQQPARLRDLVATYGSPLNLHDTGPFDRNVARLQAVADARRVPLEILFARKADKALAYVDRARALGIGVDTASELELEQVLAHGLDPARIASTAAVKADELLRLAIAARVTIVVDNDDELERVLALADAAGATVPIALRFGGFDLDGVASPTRFGFEVGRGPQLGARLAEPFGRRVVRLEGVHFHLDGYDVAHRIAGVTQLLPVIDRFRQQGHPVRHLDVGGGLPMSYVDDGDQWATFGAELRRALVGERSPVTYGDHGLGLHVHDGRVHGELALYPYHQAVTAPTWLATLLDARPGRHSIAEELCARDLTLRCEPGRSVLDGCGLTVARVEHRKRLADGSWSLGVAMNRTQCSTSKADHAVDPLLVPAHADIARTEPVEGYLMGTYCTESDLLTWRRLRFPSGVARGDLIVFPNTAGYLMHFVESRSHRFPLATNLVHDGALDFRVDAIDASPADRV